MAKGDRGHDLLPLAPAGRAERGRRRPRPSRLAARRSCTQWAAAPAARLAARHDRAVDPRHQAQRGRAGPAARRRRGRRGLGARARRPSATRPPTRPASTGRRRTCSGRRWSGPGRSPPTGCTTTWSRRSARPSSTPSGSTPTRTTRRACWPWPSRASATRRPARRRSDAVEANAERRPGDTSSAAKLLQLRLPGVPDVYQGCEIVDLSLVDPDNRRPVDYARGEPAGPARRRAPAPSTSTTRSCWSPRGRCGCAASRPRLFGDGASYARCPASSARRHASRVRRGAGGPAARHRRHAAPHGSPDGGWGDATVDPARGRVARRAHRARRCPAARCRWPTCSPTCRSRCRCRR